MLEGYVTVIEPDSITVLDQRNQVVQIRTGKDLTSQIPVAAPVRVWYTSEGGVNHLEDITIIKEVKSIPTSPIVGSIKRIIILPQVEGVEDTDGLMNAISTYLTDTAGWFVGPPELAQEVATHLQESSPSLDVLDPSSGDFDTDRYMQAQGALAGAVANRTHSDAVLVVRIFKVKAEMKNSIATWDGMKEHVASHKSFIGSPWGGGKGWVWAATADLRLWSVSGSMIWQNRRGFAVLAMQAGMNSKFQERPLSAVYDDQGRMNKWLQETFAQLTSPGTGPGGEPSQLSPELQEQINKIKQGGEEQK
jgi:hypothetical protein